MPDDRPAPRLDRFFQLTVPPEHLAEMAWWLAALREFLTGRQPPASVTQPRVTPRLDEYIERTARASREYAASRARAAGTTRAVSVPAVLGPAQPVPVSEAEEITTAQAHDLTGISAEWWRRLAVAGRVRARLAPRKVWLLNRADVIAYGRKHRSGTGGAGSSEDGHHGDPGGPDSGGQAGRGTAA